MILYFSGTGNSRFVARLIADALGDEAVSINEHLINGSERSFSSETPYVVVCPTYCYAIPTAVRDFLLSASFFTGSSNMYFVMTCGAGIGGAPYLNDRLCRRIGMNHMGTEKLVMPDNYLVMYEPSCSDEAQALVDSAPQRLGGIIDSIKANEPIGSRSNAVFGSFSGAAAKIFNAAVGKPGKFTVSDSCTSCGLCEKNCPMGCITLKDGHPTWKSGCIHCLSCICGCPSNAIDYGRSTYGRRRHYLYPDGTLKV